MEKAIRITLVISNLASGGSERVMSLMANYWVRKGWEVTLLTLDDGSTPPFYEIDSRVRFLPLGIYRASSNQLAAIWNNLQRVYVLRSAIQKSEPSVVISFIHIVNVLVFLATRGMGLPVIVSERNYPAGEPVKLAWDRMRRLAYRYVDRLVVQTERSKECFSPRVQAKTAVIPNPVSPENSEEANLQEVTLGRPSIVAMGSFYPKKGFDLLLKAFALIGERHPHWSVTILGDGPLRPSLESLRDELGLQERVHLPGRVKTTNQVLAQADLFVMPSRWEGWSMALTEAMSCGVAVIATDCYCGPRELICDGVDGVLVPPENVEALAAAMDELMSNEQERNHLACRAVEVRERLSLDKVMGMWEEMLREVVPNAIHI